MQIYYPDGNGGRKIIKCCEGNGDSAQVRNAINRIAQNETNTANLFMQLDAVADPLGANLLIFEDFKTCRYTDLFKVKVLETVGGPSDVYVQSLNGILIGHYYTLSDGVHSQFLRVKALATNDGLCNVMFEEIVSRTFNLAKTYLYRTTGLVVDGVLNGASSAKEVTFTFGDTWKGVSSDTAQTITLPTVQKNVANFELSGDFAFTNDGQFTLA